MAQGRVFATLMLLALPAASLGVTSSLTFDAAAAKKRPVSKVIKLLQDMQKQLEKEAREDEDLYEKLACWCETNDKEKTKSISDAEAKLEQLTVKIEEHTAKSSKLVVEIDNLDSEVAKDQKSLDEATALRKQQLAEFNAEETETLESIASLKAAVSVLSKHQGGASLLQMPRTHLLGVAATLQHEMQKHADLLAGVISPSEKRRAAAFIQAPEDYFDKQGAPGTGGSSYAPQSGEIFGILTTMKDTFEENLANSQKEEAANQKAYEELKAAKEEEISAGQEQLESKKELRADTDEKNAQAKEDVTDTKEALGADEEFIMMLKEKCQMTDHEWEERKKTRQLEIKAVSKALSTLSGDDAHDVFTRTFNPALLQRESITNSARRDQVAKVLSTAAQKLHSPRLAELAYQVRLDAFTKVKKAIDEMIVNLLKEKEEEIKLKAFCVEEFNKNEVQTARKERKKQDLIDQIKALQAAIKKLEQEIDTLKSEIAEMKSQMKKASEDREEENKEHKMTVSDQRETQRLLKAALSVLEDFYGKKAAMLQQQQRREPAGPPPPPSFDKYEKSGASGGVMDMIRGIMDEAKTLEADSIKDEADAQKAYELFVKETNASIDAKSKEIVSKRESKAKKEEEVVEAKESKEVVMEELAQLSESDAQLHLTCDFTMDNFEVRQTARDEEVEALREAKAVLSGAKFGEFLQQNR